MKRQLILIMLVLLTSVCFAQRTIRTTDYTRDFLYPTGTPTSTAADARDKLELDSSDTVLFNNLGLTGYLQVTGAVPSYVLDDFGVGVAIPLQKFHVKVGTSGATAAGTGMILENSGSVSINLLSPDGAYVGQIYFGNVTDPAAGALRYDHTTDSMILYTSGIVSLTLDSTGLDVVGNITLSGTVDGIDIATDVAANTAKVSSQWTTSGSDIYYDTGAVQIRDQAMVGGVESTSGPISNLVSQWKMNDDAANTTVVDTQGTNNGTLNGGNTEDKTVAGKINAALGFDGTGDYITIGLFLNTSSSFSIVGWAKVTDKSIQQGFFGTNDQNTNRSYIGLRDGNYWSGVGDIQKYTVTASGITNNVWFHWALVASSGTATWYLNGSEVDTVSFTGQGLQSVHANTIGALNGSAGPDTETTGALDDVRVYSKALSQTEINSIYNSGSGTETNPLVGATHQVIATTAYVSSHGLDTLADLAIEGELEVNGDVFIDGTIQTDTDFAGNLAIGGSTHPASATKSLSLYTGTAPSAGITDGYVTYSADRGGTAGKAGLHIWTEDDTKHVFSDRVGIGTITPDSAFNIVTSGTDTPLTIMKASESGVRELIMVAKVSDVGDDVFGIVNGSNNNSQFAPTFFGYKDSSDSPYSINLRAMTSAANDASDSSTFGLVSLEAFRTDSASNPNSGSLSKIQNRKIFTIKNYADTYFEVAASGAVDINQTLNVDGNITTGGTVDGIDIASWIDQDVSNGAAPVLDATNMTNLPSPGDAWSDAVDAVITPDGDGTRDLGLTGTRFATGFFDDLDVTTDIDIGGALSIKSNAATYESNGTVLSILNQVDGASADIYIKTRESGTPVHNMTITAQGNVIIGNSASDPADMVGGLAITAGTPPTGNISNQFSIYSADRGATAGKAGLHIRSEDGTSHVFSDRVGIGTTTPSQELEVVGDIALSGSISIGGTQASPGISALLPIQDDGANYGDGNATLAVGLPDISLEFFKIKISGGDYSDATGPWEVFISGYEVANGWVNCQAHTTGFAMFDDIRFAELDSGTSPVILLGTTSTPWLRKQAAVTYFWSKGNTAATLGDFSLTWLTSEVGYTVDASESLTVTGGRFNTISLKEITTPTADTNFGKLYTKTDDHAYFQDGAGDEHELAYADTHFGEMFTYESAGTLIIDTANEYHAVQGILETGLLSNFTFQAGSTGPIASTSTGAGASVTINDVGHGLSVGDYVQITGTTSYNDTYEVATVPNVDSFTIAETNSEADEGGGDSKWDEGDYLEAGTGAAGDYSIHISFTISAGNPIKTWKCEPVKNVTHVDNAAFMITTSGSDHDSSGAGGFITVADGDRIWAIIKNVTDTTNLAYENVNVNLFRL